VIDKDVFDGLRATRPVGQPLPAVCQLNKRLRGFMDDVMARRLCSMEALVARIAPAGPPVAAPHTATCTCRSPEKQFSSTLQEQAHRLGSGSSLSDAARRLSGWLPVSTDIRRVTRTEGCAQSFILNQGCPRPALVRCWRCSTRWA
jgi:hypothetical protein